MLGFQGKKTTKCFSPHFLRPKFMADFDKASLTVPFQQKKTPQYRRCEVSWTSLRAAAAPGVAQEARSSGSGMMTLVEQYIHQ